MGYSEVRQEYDRYLMLLETRRYKVGASFSVSHKNQLVQFLVPVGIAVVWEDTQFFG